MDYRSWDQDSVFPSFSDPFFAAHLARYIFAARFIQGKVVLDLGCGKGYGSSVLARAAESVLAVDLNPESIEFANANYRSDNLVYSLQDVRIVTPEIKNRFDAVVSFEVLEHLAPADADAFMETIKNLLKPDGLLIISTPNHEVVAKSQMPVPDFHINNLTSNQQKTFYQKHFHEVEMYGQVENRNWLEMIIYYLDLFNWRHSKIARHLRKQRPSSEPLSVPRAQEIWKHETGAGPAAKFHFSRFLWRQAGMSFAILRNPK